LELELKGGSAPIKAIAILPSTDPLSLYGLIRRHPNFITLLFVPEWQSSPVYFGVVVMGEAFYCVPPRAFSFEGSNAIKLAEMRGKSWFANGAKMNQLIVN
jgi:hypothetical protein